MYCNSSVIFQEQSNKLKLHQNLIFRIFSSIVDFANCVRNSSTSLSGLTGQFYKFIRFNGTILQVYPWFNGTVLKFIRFNGTVLQVYQV